MVLHGLWLGAILVLGVPLPPGSRAADPGRRDDAVFVSSRGFRDTVAHVQRYLARAGVAHRAVPTYRRGAVTVARFIASAPTSPWRAIHIFQLDGRTYLAIVASVAPASVPPPAAAARPPP